MNSFVHIQLSDYIGDTLNTRSAVRSIVSNINVKEKKIISIRFDFKKVDFVSRNAMHEILSTNELLDDKDLKIVFENMNKQILSMCKLVENSSKKMEKTIIKRYIANSVSDFNRLVTI